MLNFWMIKQRAVHAHSEEGEGVPHVPSKIFEKIGRKNAKKHKNWDPHRFYHDSKYRTPLPSPPPMLRMFIKQNLFFILTFRRTLNKMSHHIKLI